MGCEPARQGGGLWHRHRRRRADARRLIRLPAAAARAVLEGTALLLVCSPSGRQRLSPVACGGDDWPRPGTGVAWDLGDVGAPRRAHRTAVPPTVGVAFRGDVR